MSFMTLNSKNGDHPEFVHEIKCIFCHKVIHQCNDEDCKVNQAIHYPDKIKNAPIKINMGLNPWTDGICKDEDCQLKWIVKMWELAFTQYTTEFNLEEAKVINSTFRILMLRPEKIQQMVEAGTLDAIVTPMEFVTARTYGWENMSPEAVQTMVEILAAALKRVSEIALKQNSKIKIKDKLNAETAKKMQTPQAPPKVSTPKAAPKSNWEKFLEKQRKIYAGVPDEKLIPHLATMGYTQESVNNQ